MIWAEVGEYAARVVSTACGLYEGATVFVEKDGEVVGRGVWCGQIEDCDAVIGAAAYAALDKEIDKQMRRQRFRVIEGDKR